MEIARLRLLAQTLHVIESGDINPKTVVEKGWAHSLSEARQKRIGRNYEQITEDHDEYRRRKFNDETEKTIQRKGIMLFGLLQSVGRE